MKRVGVGGVGGGVIIRTNQALIVTSEISAANPVNRAVMLILGGKQ